MALIPAEIARKNEVIPLSLNHGRLLIATAAPMQQNITQLLGFITGLSIDLAIVSLKDVQWAVRQYYGAQDDES